MGVVGPIGPTTWFGPIGPARFVVGLVLGAAGGGATVTIGRNDGCDGGPFVFAGAVAIAAPAAGA